MRDFQSAMMERNGSVGRLPHRTIFFISRNRASDGGELGADLVAAAGLKINLQQG